MHVYHSNACTLLKFWREMIQFQFVRNGSTAYWHNIDLLHLDIFTLTHNAFLNINLFQTAMVETCLDSQGAVDLQRVTPAGRVTPGDITPGRVTPGHLTVNPVEHASGAICSQESVGITSSLP